MNNIMKNNNLISKINNYIRANYKLLLMGLSAIFLIFIFFQFYIYYQNTKILETSREYYLSKSNNSDDFLQNKMKKISKEKNFYGVLAKLELINLQLKNKDILLAYDGYSNLLSSKDLSSIYKSAIALHGSYNVLNFINLKSGEDLKVKQSDINLMINNLITFIDPDLISFEGYKLEILYLLSVYNIEIYNDLNYLNESKKLYKEIQENDKISSSIKERIEKIHEFQKYN